MLGTRFTMACSRRTIDGISSVGRRRDGRVGIDDSGVGAGDFQIRIAFAQRLERARLDMRLRPDEKHRHALGLGARAQRQR